MSIHWPLPHTDLLRRLGANETAKAAPRKRLPKGKGYDLDARPRAHRTRLDDNEVLLCRAFWELDRGWSQRMLAAHFQVDVIYMNRMLRYQTRSKLQLPAGSIRASLDGK